MTAPICDRYGVMGNPIAQSCSPEIHAAFAAQTGQILSYERILVPLENFGTAVRSFQQSGGRGLNITTPFKEEAWHMADRLSIRAQAAKAVNTYIFQADGSVLGENTDGIGFIRDLVQNHGFTFENKRILLLGAGGAARGILSVLSGMKPSLIHLSSRTHEKVAALALEFSKEMQVVGTDFADLKGKQFDLIINATTSSLYDSPLSLPKGLLAPGSCCYDLVYGKTETAFLQWGKSEGAANLWDGFGMLVEQAAEAFYLWRGVRPETRALLKTLKSKCYANS